MWVALMIMALIILSSEAVKELSSMNTIRTSPDLSPKKARKNYSGEGGSYFSWSPRDLPMLRIGNIGAAKLRLTERGFALPAYSDSTKIAYVLQGNGTAGILMPETPKEKVIPIKSGDAIALPFGTLTWYFNPNPDDIIILFLGDTSKSHLSGHFTDFPLAGTAGTFTGLSHNFLSHAFDLSPAVATKLVNSQNASVLIKVSGSQSMPESSSGDRKGLVLNCLEAPLNVDVKGAGKVVVVNGGNLPVAGEVGMGADLVRIEGHAMVSPGFSSDSAYQVTYIVRGSGRLQVAGVGGERVVDTAVEAGWLFVVPRFFVVSKIAGGDGLEWFSIITTPNPVFSQLAGRTAVWKKMSPEVLQASFNISPEMEKLLRSKRNSDEIFFPPSK